MVNKTIDLFNIKNDVKFKNIIKVIKIEDKMKPKFNLQINKD